MIQVRKSAIQSIYCPFRGLKGSTSSTCLDQMTFNFLFFFIFFDKGWEKVQRADFPKYRLTCSGLRPGGTQAYSSDAQPESSSEMECLRKSDTSFVIIFSSWPGNERTACSSRSHLQCMQIFLWMQLTKNYQRHLLLFVRVSSRERRERKMWRPSTLNRRHIATSCGKLFPEEWKLFKLQKGTYINQHSWFFSFFLLRLYDKWTKQSKSHNYCQMNHLWKQPYV